MSDDETFNVVQVIERHNDRGRYAFVPGDTEKDIGDEVHYQLNGQPIDGTLYGKVVIADHPLPKEDFNEWANEHAEDLIVQVKKARGDL